MAYNTFQPIVTSGLVYYIDPENKKSLPMVDFTLSTFSTTGASYAVALTRVSDSENHPILFSLSGNSVSQLNGYIAGNGGTLPVTLSGVSPEVVNITTTFWDSVQNRTVLLPDPLPSSVTMSSTCSITFDYGSPYVKIPNVDLTGIFNSYFQYYGSITLSMTGGASPIVNATVSGFTSSDFAFNRVSDNTQQPILMSLPGQSNYHYFSKLISDNGGSISLNLSGGITPEVYTASWVGYDSYSSTTYLGTTPTGSVTMSVSCGITNSYGPNLIAVPGNKITAFSIYSQYSGNSIPVLLTGGATAENYNIYGPYNFDGTNTILYDSGFLGTLYTDHTQMEFVVPVIEGITYMDNTFISYSFSNYSEDYSVDQVLLSGSDTILYNNISGLQYIGHTEFSGVVPEFSDMLYINNTNIDFNYLVPPSGPCYNLVDGASASLNNGVGVSKSFDFDGVDDYIEPQQFNITAGQDLSLDMIVKINSTQVAYADIFDYNHGSPGFGFVIQQNPIFPFSAANWYFAWAIAPFTYDFLYMTLPLDEFFHLSITKAGTSLVYYINGVQAGSYTAGSSTINATGNNSRIGDYVYGNRNFNGSISAFKIYSRALSADEVRQNYLAQKMRFLG